MLHSHKTGHHTSACCTCLPSPGQTFHIDTTDRIDRDRTRFADLSNKFHTFSLQSFLAVCLKDGAKNDLRGTACYRQFHIFHTMTGNADLCKVSPKFFPPLSPTLTAHMESTDGYPYSQAFWQSRFWSEGNTIYSSLSAQIPSTFSASSFILFI